MAAELGAQTGIIEPDEVTTHYLVEAGVVPGEWQVFESDANAKFLRVHEFNADKLEPQIAAPNSPSNVFNVSDADNVEIDQFYIGAYTGAKLSDLRMVASVLEGNKIAPGKRLTVAPASSRIMADATREGVMQILLDAGANLLPTGCGACAGYGVGVLAENEVCLASTARNFQGRMGANSSKVYLASPYTVAASAINGYVTDPREVLGDNL